MRDFEKPTVPDCTMSKDLRQSMEELCEHLYSVVMLCSSGLLRLAIAVDDLNKLDQLDDKKNSALSMWIKSLHNQVIQVIFKNHPEITYDNSVFAQRAS